MTGGRRNLGPLPSFRRGLDIEVDVKGKYYPGKIEKVDDANGQCDVLFTDKTIGENIKHGGLVCFNFFLHIFLFLDSFFPFLI